MSPVCEYFLLPLSPVLALVSSALGLIFLECFPKGSLRFLKNALAYLGPLAAIFFTWYLYKEWPINFSTVGYSSGPVWLNEFARTFRLDQLSLGFFWAINVFLFFSLVFMGIHFEKDHELSEIFILSQFIACGMMLLVSANSLLMIFMGLELLSLPTYVLVGIQKSDINSSEAALKYFLFGSFATVLLLFGIALLYAQFGTLNIPQITELLKAGVVNSPEQRLLVGGSAALLLIAVGFKVGIVPFHMWVPDAYEGAPSPVTGFMGSAVKLAGFGLVIRIFWGIFLSQSEHWSHLLAILAVVSMFLGNIAALTQNNLKRLFAYSSISHAGYLLLGIAAFAAPGPNAQILYYYLVIYGFMFLGVFGVLALVERQTGSTDIASISGLGFSHPALGVAFSIFALSAAGIPPTAGFLAKYFLFLEAVRAGRTPLVVLAVISSVIGVYYYLRVLVYLYMREPKEKLVFPRTSRAAMISIFACAFCILYFALFPFKLGM